MTKDSTPGRDFWESSLREGLEQRFTPSFRDSQESEGIFVQFFMKHNTTVPGSLQAIARMQQSMQLQSPSEMNASSKARGKNNMVILDETGSFSTLKSENVQVFPITNAFDWGILRHALGVRMSQLHDIQEQLHQGNAVFVTELGIQRLFTQRPHTQQFWGGH